MAMGEVVDDTGVKGQARAEKSTRGSDSGLYKLVCLEDHDVISGCWLPGCYITRGGTVTVCARREHVLRALQG